ncbi:hypothetical protein [Streptomyces sp. NPDC059009]|uniref:hypothetical protein n=1 Tax=Streptomyces sp. NPDC059009 TaxID=3346694 RepID=UPI0036C4E610
MRITTLRITTPRITTRTSVAAACAALLLAGCSGGGSGHDGQGPARPPAPPSVSSEPIPAGKGSHLPDDLNGDGHPELLVPGGGPDPQTPERLAVVFGSRHGLDPRTRTVLNATSLGLPFGHVGHTDYGKNADLGSGVVPADLDGDGYADLSTTWGGKPDGGSAGDDSTTEAYISWGTPKGPRPGRKATRIQLGDRRVNLGLGLERGDFNGDGKHDLLAYAADEDGDTERFYVLYGPFSRSGKPARVTRHGGLRDAADDEGVVVDEIAQGRATSVVAPSCNTGSEDADLLFAAGPSGLGPARELPAGDLPAWGDFDGDGRRELAVANDPTCDYYVEEESGPDWRAPRGAATTVKVLDGTRLSRTVTIPKSAAPMATGNLDGTGPDELLIGHGDPKDTLEDPAGGYTTLGVTVLPGARSPHALPHVPRNTALDTVRDFDGDGRDEVVLRKGAKVYVIDGRSPGRPPVLLGRF